MTLGDKIRKYRSLNGLTQKELGLKIGFSSATADSRIRKYEKDLMAPKDDIRNKLAEALNIDIEALSDINISSYIDIMYIFFELEEKIGLDVIKKDGRTYLSFDDSDKDIATLISYLNLWQNQKNTLAAKGDDVSDDELVDYLLWKSRFKKNVDEYYSNKEEELNNLYSPMLANLSNTTHAKKTSEITLLLREIIEAGISLSVTNKFISTGVTAQGFTFAVNELLSPPNDNCAALFAKFLYEYNHFIELGADCFTDMQITDKLLTITYYVPVSSFSVITAQINKFLEFRENRDNQTDFSIDSFETSFEESLKTYYNDIEEEIKMYTK